MLEKLDLTKALSQKDHDRREICLDRRKGCVAVAYEAWDARKGGRKHDQEA
jgi:hypothetical protein